jgi:hypothetical protein
MAYAEVETIVHGNPARKGHKMARKMSLKQLRYFGTKRQKAAAKHRRKIKAKSKHRPRTKPNSAKRTAPRKHHAKANRAVRHKKKKKQHRSNPGEIISFALNPARKKGKHMAASQKKKRRSKASAKRNAGHKVKHHMKRRHHNNPGMLGAPKDWLAGGSGVLLGVVGTRTLPQLVLGASNTGPMGYAANAVTTGLLTWLAHMFVKNRVFSASVLAGGVASIISRIISDYSLLGSFSSQLGLGDYMVSNWTQPQRLTDGLHSAMISNNGYQLPGSTAMVVGQGSAAGAAAGSGMGSYDSLY